MKVIFQRHDPSLAARAIRVWTRSPHSHCELLFSDGMMFSSHLADNGTRFRKMEQFNALYWDMLDIPTTEAEEEIVRNFCGNELGCRYDWWGIWFSQVIPLRREHPDKWFCSEICAAALQKIDLLGSFKPCTLSPGKLFKRLRETGAPLCVQF